MASALVAHPFKAKVSKAAGAPAADISSHARIALAFAERARPVDAELTGFAANIATAAVKDVRVEIHAFDVADRGPAARRFSRAFACADVLAAAALPAVAAVGLKRVADRATAPAIVRIALQVCTVGEAAVFARRTAEVRAHTRTTFDGQATGAVSKLAAVAPLLLHAGPAAAPAVSSVRKQVDAFAESIGSFAAAFADPARRVARRPQVDGRYALILCLHLRFRFRVCGCVGGRLVVATGEKDEARKAKDPQEPHARTLHRGKRKGPRAV